MEPRIKSGQQSYHRQNQEVDSPNGGNLLRSMGWGGGHRNTNQNGIPHPSSKVMSHHPGGAKKVKYYQPENNKRDSPQDINSPREGNPSQNFGKEYHKDPHPPQQRPTSPTPPKQQTLHWPGQRWYIEPMRLSVEKNSHRQLNELHWWIRIFPHHGKSPQKGELIAQPLQGGESLEEVPQHPTSFRQIKTGKRPRKKIPTRGEPHENLNKTQTLHPKTMSQQSLLA